MAVAVDAMGGDRAPSAIVEGAVRATKEFGLKVILVGDESILKKELDRFSFPKELLRLYHAGQVVGMDESPSEALRKKPKSSIRVAFNLVRKGEASAVVSAGNSGATLACAMVTVGRICGVRPAIATVMPTLKNPVVLIDVGANVDCKPHHLLQFGIMGAAFSKEAIGNKRPRVGLLSIGEENTKGNQQVKKAFDLLSKSSLNFVGNVEGRDVFKGDVDVVVCDGFVGNVSLKLSEGLAESILLMLKKEIQQSSIITKIGYLLARSAFKRFRRLIDYSEYGGAPLLGIKGIGIICHGRSGPSAICNAVRVANTLVRADFVKHLESRMQQEVSLASVAL